MTIKEFILQGFTERTHANALREMFDIPDIKRVSLSVAFISESGVQEIEEQLKTHAGNTTIFAGIRNDITSHQGLMRLHSIIGSKLYIVDTGARNLLFHPKLYFACSEEQARLIVGSANLTLGGLNNNVEASMVLDFDLTDKDDKVIVDNIETLLSSLPTEYPGHVVKVRSINELDDLLLSGRIADEMTFPAPRQTAADVEATSIDTIPRIILKVPRLRRALAKERTNLQTSKTEKLVKTSVSPTKFIPTTVGVDFELVWESKPLRRRDLNIPDESNTHPTGSMSLDKGLLSEEVDHRHYFRDDVFSSLTWASRSATVDEAFAKFQLILKGINYGEFDLAVRHTNSTTTTAYQQRNAMTRLSWGPMRERIARPDLIDRALTLYRDKVDPTRFVLEID